MCIKSAHSQKWMLNAEPSSNFETRCERLRVSSDTLELRDLGFFKFWEGTVLCDLCGNNHLIRSRIDQLLEKIRNSKSPFCSR